MSRSVLVQPLQAAISAADKGQTQYSRMRPSADSLTPKASPRSEDAAAQMPTGFSSVTLTSTSRLRSSPTEGTRCASSITMLLECISRERTSADEGSRSCSAATAPSSPSNQDAALPSASILKIVVFPAPRGPRSTQALGGLCLRRSRASCRAISVAMSPPSKTGSALPEFRIEKEYCTALFSATSQTGDPLPNLSPGRNGAEIQG